MMRAASRLILNLITGGAVLAPLCALGHGSEFLVAKLTLQADSLAVLEVSADYAQNPLITDEAAARTALLQSLQVRAGGSFLPLDEKSVKWSADKKWNDLAPASILPPVDDEAAHRLITATWELECKEHAWVFQVPKGRLHDVLLWMPPEGDESPKWMMLLGGDVTREMAVLSPKWPWKWPLIVTLGLVVLYAASSPKRRSGTR